MKKTLTILLFLAIGSFGYGQQIAVVSPGGATSIYTSLDTAILNAASGSTIYLSGGLFNVKDGTSITKKLNIIGIGHRFDNDNVEGNTIVKGFLFFAKDSDSSSVSHLYLAGNIMIGADNRSQSRPVSNISLRYLNASNNLYVTEQCKDIIVEQCYVRGSCSGGGSNLHVKNSILSSIGHITGGIIENNVITNTYPIETIQNAFSNIKDSKIKNNILISPGNIVDVNNCIILNNMVKDVAWGNNSTVISEWNEEFEGLHDLVESGYNYHLKSGSKGKNKGVDGTDIGIYGGSGFDDNALPNGLRIRRKNIAERTGTNGDIRVQLEIKFTN